MFSLRYRYRPFDFVPRIGVCLLSQRALAWAMLLNVFLVALSVSSPMPPGVAEEIVGVGGATVEPLSMALSPANVSAIDSSCLRRRCRYRRRYCRRRICLNCCFFSSGGLGDVVVAIANCGINMLRALFVPPRFRVLLAVAVFRRPLLVLS